jgi:hypothetical protein
MPGSCGVRDREPPPARREYRDWHTPSPAQLRASRHASRGSAAAIVAISRSGHRTQALLRFPPTRAATEMAEDATRGAGGSSLPRRRSGSRQSVQSSATLACWDLGTAERAGIPSRRTRYPAPPSCSGDSSSSEHPLTSNFSKSGSRLHPNIRSRTARRHGVREAALANRCGCL